MIGSIANNRFLKRVNPEILRALDETGAAASMRQMVDLDIAKNLIGWWHRDNVNTRTSGSDTFVTQANDSSGGSNNATQATQANQPKLLALGIDFTGTAYHVLSSSTASAEVSYLYADTGITWSYGLWYNGTSGVICGAGGGIGSATTNAIYLSGSELRVRLRGNTTDDLITSSGTGSWKHIMITWNGSNGYAYYNGGSAILLTPGTASNQNTEIALGFCNAAISAGNYAHYTGTLNDARVFNSALTVTEIAAIHNQTKGAYGL